MDTIPRTQVRGHLMIRAKPQSGYALIGREFLQDRNLKGEARIVGAYLLSHAENWEVRVPHLAAHFGWNKDKIYRLLKSIIAEGYGARRRLKGEAGQFGGVQYLICDCKREVAEIKAQWAEEGNASIDDTPGEAEIVDEFEPSLALEESADAIPDTDEPCLAEPCTEKPDTDIIEKDNNLTPQSPPKVFEKEGSQGKPVIDWEDPDASFPLMERRYDEAGKLNFAGKTQRAVKTWRKMTPDKRKQAWLVAPNWFKGKAAQIAKWHASPRKDRGRMPSYASLAEYLSLSLFEGVGLPVEPQAVEVLAVPQALIDACWQSKLGEGSRVFVERDSTGWLAWSAAWARVKASGIKNTFRGSEFLGLIPAGSNGAWFCSEYPPDFVPLRPEEIDERVMRAS